MSDVTHTCTANAGKRFPALAALPTLHFWTGLIISSIICEVVNPPRLLRSLTLLVRADLAWQGSYYYFIIVKRADQIHKQGRVTSFT